ncbi:MAG TPA: peptidoglycan-binding protein [Thermomonospora sp.]|nr:peptidoglycan-binding protein [Thermomonospora sp.]
MVVEEVAGGSRGRRRRRRWRGLVVVVVGVVVAGVGVVVARPFDEPGRGSEARSVVPTGLATVKRGRLSARTSVSGTLGYVGSYTAVNQATGTYTKLPRTGRVVRQGRPLYWVSGKPVVLLKGSSVPLYRDLRQGMSGTDVRQLNAALVELGYAPASGLDPRSRYFGWATAYALRGLQEDLGIEENGRLAKSQAVFLPRDRVRITKVGVTVGTPATAGAPVLQAGSTTRLVTVSLDATLQSQVKKGDRVTITLPDQKTTQGTVSSVGTVAKATSSGGATVTVRITPNDPQSTGRLDQAPVGVSILTESVDDALAVPVNALLALLDGGYGVEVVDARGGRRLVPVTVGLFDNSAGMVQVSGRGLAAGQRVVVPAS